MDLEKIVNVVANGALDGIKKKIKLYGGIIVGCFAGALIIFCSIFGTIFGAKAKAMSYSNVSSSGWENFKRFVLVNEGGTTTEDGKYYIVEDDSQGNPTVGHGLCLYSKVDDVYLHKEAFANHNINSVELANNWISGDRTGKVSVDICDQIWEENLKGIYDSIKSSYSYLGLSTYQYYALTDVKYRRGNTNGFEDAYNEKWSGNDNRYKKDTKMEEYSQDSLYSFFNNGFTDTSSRCVYKKTKTVETF